MWTYPICIACGAPILSPDQRDSTSRMIHWICPDVEDLDMLPLVERAAIACSMYASDGGSPPFCRRVFGSDVVPVIGADANDVAVMAMNGAIRWRIDASIDSDALWALAEAMLRTGEVVP